jgi:hypothetical protein
MTPLVTSGIVLVCIFASALVALFLRARLPDQHLTAETKEVVQAVMGVVGIMTGIVLGLLVASAKSSFDGYVEGVAQLAANVVVLDRTLAHFGPESQEARSVLRKSVADMVHRMWPREPAPLGGSESLSSGEGRYDEIYTKILALEPKNDAQRTTQAHALKMVHDTAQVRWHLYSEQGSSIPIIFLVLMVAWMSLSFAAYGLFAPRHATSLVVLFLGAFVVSSAVFLILELDQGFGGMIRISSEPMRNAILQLGQ